MSKIILAKPCPFHLVNYCLPKLGGCKKDCSVVVAFWQNYVFLLSTRSNDASM